MKGMGSMEQVLVVRTENISHLLNEKSLLTEDTDTIIKTILKNCYYCDRDVAENCGLLKQIIPYVILRKEDEIFIVERLKKQTEKRLHGKLSIGIGGHINPDASEAHNPIEYGLLRELHEEVKICSVDEIKYIGIINDLSTPVSNFHIGIVYEIWTGDNIYVLETDKMTGNWQKLAYIREVYDYLETWSQIIFNYIEKEVHHVN